MDAPFLSYSVCLIEDKETRGNKMSTNGRNRVWNTRVWKSVEDSHFFQQES